MKLCPSCSASYPDEFNFCPLDAKPLQLPPTAGLDENEPDEAEETPPETAVVTSPARLESTIQGRYRIERHLGGGGLGKVFAAVDLEGQGRCAVKVLRQELTEDAPPGRFLRQAEPLTAVRHPGLAAVWEAGETEDGSPFLVMELVEGTGALELPQPVPLTTLCQLGREVAEALAALHAFGTIHGDLKPRHIVRTLSPEGPRWKLLDVGLLPILKAMAAPEAITGTPGYTAPERLRPDDRMDPRSDLFSLGVVLFELLAGQLPPPERPAIPVLRPGPRIPEGLQRLVLQLLDADPDRRPGSAWDVATALAALEEELAGQCEINLPMPVRIPSPAVRRWQIEEVSRRQAGIAGKAVAAIAFSRDGRLLASGGSDGLVRLWDLENGRSIRELAGHEGAVHAVAFSPAAALLASGGRDGTVRLWDFRTGSLLVTLAGHTGPVRTAVFSCDGRTLATSGSDREVWIWEAATGQPRRRIGSPETVSAADLSPSGREVVYGTVCGHLEVVDVETLRIRAGFRAHRETVAVAAFSPDGALVASGGLDRTVRLWNAETGERIAVLARHEQAVSALAFHPGGALLASAGLDGTIRLWDPVAGRLLETLEVRGSFVTSVAFSPAGDCLAAGTDRTIEIWESVKIHQADLSYPTTRW